MSKTVPVGGIVSPANLWGKPLPKTTHKVAEEKKKRDTGMLSEDEIDSDVDEELETDGPSDDELAVAEEPETEIVASSEEIDEDFDDVDDDDDDEDSDAEDADEDDSDAADEEEVDSTVDADDDDYSEEDEEIASSAKTKVVNTMADKKKKSMSDHVRDEIDRRKTAGDSLRGVDIVNALAKRGVKVSAAQVSQLLKKAGISQKARGPKTGAKAPVAATTEPKSRVAESIHKGVERKPGKGLGADAATELTQKMRAVKDFLAACGDSYDAATEALGLHKQLHDVI